MLQRYVRMACVQRAIHLRSKTIRNLTAIVCMLVGALTAAQAEETLGDVVLNLEPSADNPRNSEGDFIQLNDDRILFIYTHFTGGQSDHASAYLASRQSDDGGRTWSSESKKVIANEGGMNIMSVSLLRLQSGDIGLFYLRKNSLDDCRMLMRRSSDDGETWSDEIVCTDPPEYYVVNNDRVIQLQTGRLLVSAALHQWEGEKRILPADALCFISDDEGRTWRRSTTIIPAIPESRTGHQEPGVVELPDGRVWMFTRTDKGVQYQSFSLDGGDTWSEAGPTTIQSPVAPASIERIPGTDQLLMVWNDHSSIAEALKAKRTPLTVAISEDGGKTWPRKTVIEDDPEGWYCYTAIAFVEGHVLLGYCAGDSTIGGLNRTRIRRIALDSIQ